MGLPRKKEQGNSINITPKNEGMQRQLDLMTKTDPHSAFTLGSIGLKDHDDSILELFKNGKLKTVIKGNNVPAIFLTLENWAKFERSWKSIFDKETDGAKNDKDLLPPFITIKRGDVVKGTHRITKYGVPDRMKFSSQLIPHLSPTGDINYLRVKSPQPIPTDISYTITLYTQYMKDQNTFDELMLKSFTSNQLYIDTKNHYFSVTIESVSDDAETDDVNSVKIYIKTYELLLIAYLIDESEVEIIETNRSNKIDIIMP